MILRSTTQIERSFFYLASFGAANALSILLSSCIALLFLAFGNTLTFSASLWIFLFLFPGALAVSTVLIAAKFEHVLIPGILHTVIVGYGAYSALSLFILLMGGRNEPALWTLLMLALVSLALFNTRAIFSRLGMNDSSTSVSLRGNRELDVSNATLPLTITPQPKKQVDHSRQPIISIRDNARTIDADGERESHAGSDLEQIIHLGPRR